MRTLKLFMESHSSSDLMVLGFFLMLGAVVTGWVLDVILRDRGFGVFGNGLLVFLGGFAGILMAQANGSFRSFGEVNRILLFSTASASLLLTLFCLMKARFSSI